MKKSHFSFNFILFIPLAAFAAGFTFAACTASAAENSDPGAGGAALSPAPSVASPVSGDLVAAKSSLTALYKKYAAALQGGASEEQLKAIEAELSAAAADYCAKLKKMGVLPPDFQSGSADIYEVIINAGEAIKGAGGNKGADPLNASSQAPKSKRIADVSEAPVKKAKAPSGGIFGKIVSGVSSGIKSVGNFFSGVVNGVTGFVKETYEAVKETVAGNDGDGPRAVPKPKKEFYIIGHAGAPDIEPDNTIEGMERAVNDGANAVETDLCVTKDGAIVSLHDWDPSSIIARARHLGLQGFKYRPICPNIGSGFRKPVDELTLAELREHYGYTLAKNTALTGKAKKTFHRIPTFDEFAAWAASRGEVKFIYLDVKLPESELARVPDFVDGVYAIASRHGITDRIAFASATPAVLSAAAKYAGEKGYAMNFCRDMELPSKPVMALKPEKYMSIAEAAQYGAAYCSLGRPTKVTVIGGWNSYKKIIAANVAAQKKDYQGIKVIAWTINDREEIKWLVNAGVDGVMTDNPANACAAVGELRKK